MLSRPFGAKDARIGGLRSIVAERVEGGRGARRGRRVEAEEQADPDAEAAGEGEAVGVTENWPARVGGRRRRHATKPKRPPARPHPAHHERLDEELGEDIAPLAPMARRMPISRVRSCDGNQHDVHDPDAATSSETPAMPASSIDRTRLVSAAVSRASCWLRISNRSLPARRRWRAQQSELRGGRIQALLIDDLDLDGLDVVLGESGIAVVPGPRRGRPSWDYRASGADT